MGETTATSTYSQCHERPDRKQSCKLIDALVWQPFFAITYALGFAALTSAIVHVILWHSKDIKDAIFTARHERTDDNIHNRYIILLLSSLLGRLS